MKKITLLTLTLSLSFLTACDKKTTSKDVKPNGLVQAKGDTPSTSSPIAYVEVDSLATLYTYSKEQNEILQRQQESYRATLEQKQKQLQSSYQAIQQKMQNGEYTSQQQVDQARAGFAKQQAALEKLEAQYTEAMAKKAADYQNALRDSLKNFLTEYNKEKKYGIIIAKQGDNVLYADKSLDITIEVIAGLNKRYKKK